MHERARNLDGDVDAELERIITALALAQRKRREALRRRLRRQIMAMLAAQGFRVGDIFPAAGHGRRARPTTKATGEGTGEPVAQALSHTMREPHA